MIKLKDILNESDIKWGTLDKIIKTAKYDPATGKKILKWAATHPPQVTKILEEYDGWFQLVTRRRTATGRRASAWSSGTVRSRTPRAREFQMQEGDRW